MSKIESSERKEKNFIVTRKWHIRAMNAGEAITKAKNVKHDEVHSYIETKKVMKVTGGFVYIPF